MQNSNLNGNSYFLMTFEERAQFKAVDVIFTVNEKISTVHWDFHFLHSK